MTPEEFVKEVFKEKEYLLKLYFDKEQKVYASTLIKKLQLDGSSIEVLKKIIDSVLTDAFYTVLLGLDGAASIGNRQEMYNLFDEEGNPLTGHGEIEGYAYEYFHDGKKWD
jgi:hypothetical protein